MEPSKIQAILRQIQSDPSIVTSALLGEVLPKIAEVVELNTDPRGLFKLMSDNMTDKDINSSVESIKTHMFKSLVAAHLSKELSFDACQAQMRAITRMSREMELDLRQNSHPFHKLTIKQMVVPTVPRIEEDGRFIDYLRENKLVTKTEITNIAKKVEAHFGITGKPVIYPALAEIGLSFPDIFKLQGDAVYKANPTYRVLNLALKKMGLPDLSSPQGRGYYNELEFNHVGNIKQLIGKEIELSDNAELLLNVMSEYASKWADAHQSEEDQRRNDSDIAVVAFCVSTLIESIVAVVATLRPISDIAAAIVALSLPDEVNKSTPKTLANIIIRNNVVAFDLYSLIHPYNENEYNLPPANAISGLDEHLIKFDAKKLTIDKTLVDIAINKNDSLTALKNVHFGGLVRELIKHTEDDDLYELIDRSLDGDNLPKETIKQIVGFKSALESWSDHVRKSTSFTLDDEFDATAELIFMIRSALDGIDASQKKIDILVELKKKVDAAYKNNNYDELSIYATQIKNFNVAEVVLGICAAVEPAITELMSISVFKDGLLYYINRPQDSSNTQQAANSTASQAKELKELEKKVRGIERDNKRLTDTNQQLKDEVTSQKQTITELEMKLQKTNSSQAVSELEKKFLFGEKTSLKDAVNLIKGKFPHVVFSDDIESQLDECMYSGSNKLLKFLHLLVADYFDAITNGTPDSVAKDILGKVYRANESQTVLGNQRHKRQRMFNIEGESRLMTKHLSIATSRDLRNSCSIYFDFEDGKVLIGYIGEHLDNTLT